MTPEQIVLRFVESIGEPTEARAYLELFRSGAPERFALIDPRGALEGPEARALVADLSYLIALGLSPVLWGAAPDGLKVTDATTAEEVSALAHEHELAVVRSGDLGDWAARLSSRKIIALDGPLRSPAGAIVPMVDSASEIETVELAAGHRERLRRAADLIEATQHPMTVALTSAVDLLRELFTVRGAGTLVRRGAAIEKATSVSDGAAMTALLEDAFARLVRPGLLHRQFAAIYIANDHAGAALIEPEEPAPYLSKFAVGLAARGEGIGRDLWRRLVADFPRLFWRARPANPITGWYLRQADGFFRADRWNVFWIGLEPDEIPEAIARATDRGSDFEL